MTRKTYILELITPCFCAGADPSQAEIRAPSIRGQLRWWFRVLGGFQSLASMSVRQQESYIFGSMAGDEGQAGKLVVRVTDQKLKTTVSDGQELGHRNFSNLAYLTFPIQSREKQGQKTNYAGRGVILEGSFSLSIIWRGEDHLWSDIRSLFELFGHLGSLGFRGRRAMGAFAFCSTAVSVADSLAPFQKPQAITIRKLKVSSNNLTSEFGAWLKDWRAHGRMVDHAKAKAPEPPHNSGFEPYARNDHDRGVAVGRNQGSATDATYRPALGLPIIQFFSSGSPQVEWNEKWNTEKARRNRSYKGEGRFASPVLLRPHRDAEGKWHALVIFVDAHAWPAGKQVFLNGQPRPVSLDLYNAMKADARLQSFL